MIFTNPTFEKISTPHGGSILIRKFSHAPRDTRAYWHYHGGECVFQHHAEPAQNGSSCSR